jgi:hypothetical protein
VQVRPQITLTFNRAVDTSSVTSSADCSGTVQVAAGAACVATSVSFAGDVATLVPTADLTPSTAYTVTVTTGVKDSDGVPLDAAASGGFTTIASVSLLGSDFQHVHVAWTSPNGAHVYTRISGTSDWGAPLTFAAGKTDANVLLTPGKTWDVKVAPLDGGGGEQAASEFDTVATDFAGTVDEWESRQLATGEKGGLFRFTWSDTEFFAAFDALNAANGDALWIAFDTDPDTDSTGEVSSATGGSGPKIIWPFKADFVVELKNGAANLRAGGTWTNGVAAGKKSGAGIDEIRFAKSLLGNPSSVRIALAAIATNNGYTFDLAPPHQAIIEMPTTGNLASLISSYAPLDQAFDPAHSADAASAATVHAASLAHFTVSGHAFNGTPQIAGSIAPLSYDLSQSVYSLALTDGIANTWEGVFNLGGQSGELFFKFMDGGAPEPLFSASGADRVYTLSGGNDTLPALAWSTAYGATHSFSLTFVVSDASNAPTELRGNVNELGNFGTGAALTGSNPYTAGPVAFSNHDFVTTPLEFKAYYGGSSTYEGTPGSTNDIMNDDVINSRTLSWTACASSVCPTF